VNFHLWKPRKVLVFQLVKNKNKKITALVYSMHQLPSQRKCPYQEGFFNGFPAPVMRNSMKIEPDRRRYIKNLYGWDRTERLERMAVQGILIADEDMVTRKRMAELFIKAGYQVTVTNSAAGALYGILKKTAQVVLLSPRFDELLATELIPLLKQCDHNLSIILVASELPLSLIRKARCEGIFYYALKAGRPGDEEELREAVRCAFEQAAKHSSEFSTLLQPPKEAD